MQERFRREQGNVEAARIFTTLHVAKCSATPASESRARVRVSQIKISERLSRVCPPRPPNLVINHLLNPEVPRFDLAALTRMFLHGREVEQDGNKKLNMHIQRIGVGEKYF
ncbi:MAG: hypothetical protein OXG78_13725 [Chloroflexi bacterium]|nr:hypothetical protein [Chloroflexota bacterium]